MDNFYSPEHSEYGCRSVYVTQTIFGMTSAPGVKKLLVKAKFNPRL